MKYLEKIRERIGAINDNVYERTEDGLPYEESSDLYQRAYDDMADIAEELVKYIDERCVQPNEPEEAQGE